MFTAKIYTKNLRNLLLVWFLLFAVSPCFVKDTLFSVVEVPYAKPFHKTKTTSTTSFCQFTQKSNQVHSTFKQSDNQLGLEPLFTWENPMAVIKSEKILSSYTKNFSGNSPPKYILYKRLKVVAA